MSFCPNLFIQKYKLKTGSSHFGRILGQN